MRGVRDSEQIQVFKIIKSVATRTALIFTRLAKKKKKILFYSILKEKNRTNAPPPTSRAERKDLSLYRQVRRAITCCSLA
jgi:hypothetical protein